MLESLRRGIRAARARFSHSENDKIWAHIASEASWQEAKQRASTGQRVLIATSMGGYPHGAYLESALAAALTLRGASVDILLCDRFLPACQLTEITQVTPEQLLAERPQPRCDSCHAFGKKVFEPLGLPIRWFGDLVRPSEAEQCRAVAATASMDQLTEYQADGLAVGEHALAGALRYFARGTLNGDPLSDDIARLYLESALLTTRALENLLAENRYEVVCFNHGIYVPQGLIGEVCRKRGVRVVNWNPAYRRHCFIFSHGDSYHHTMISEPTTDWEDIPWSARLETRTLDYLNSRWQGTQDWIWFHDHPQESAEQIAREIGVDFSRPCIALLTSVMWDAQLHYRSNAFPNMLDWVRRTIEYFSRRPDLQLVIRVHPAEIRGSVPSRQPIVAEIQRSFPNLPQNVFIVGPESKVSTYALVDKCDAAIIYNTKTGIEIASMGIPVIVAGEAWVRNKGFSLDASSPEEYFAILDQLPLRQRLREEQVKRARKYAFHFFFRRMIPLPFIVPVDSSVTLRLSSLEELKPGSTPGLDVVCEGILHGEPFVYPAELMS